MGREYATGLERMCTSKVRIKSRCKARAGIRRLRRFLPSESGRELIAYHCHACGTWHIGHRVTTERLLFLGVKV